VAQKGGMQHTKGSLSDYFKNKRDRKVMHRQYTENIHRQLNCGEKRL